MTGTDKLPQIICGPMIRRLTPHRLVLWWVGTQKNAFQVSCYHPGTSTPFFTIDLDSTSLTTFQFGDNAWIYLADIRPESPFSTDEKIEYNLTVSDDEKQVPFHHINPDILYPGEKRPSFVVKNRIRRFFHGSCRKPHHNSDDAFLGLEREIGETLDDPSLRPAFLMLTGDQIYADDVAGPMLQAIHQTIHLLGLYGETFEQAKVADADALYALKTPYYNRKQVLPRTKVGKKWYRRGGAKHIFSSAFANNHLVTFGEWMAMYLLVWSPVLWKYISFDDCDAIQDEHQALFKKELAAIHYFIDCLPRVRRMFAHIPTYMIFDDHDITDDWNLTARWEKRAYDHPFTRQIISNALTAYFLCQGLGNAPDKFKGPLTSAARNYFNTPTTELRERFSLEVLSFKGWHFEVPVFPSLVVMDSRTRRWKNSKRPSSPSGLLDWEAFMKLQHKLMQTDAVILVAPAPIFGVKLIELIQRIFTTFGYSLAVDAENWMGHRKSAYTLLEIFKNAKTASKNIIVSGDVHYSFVYDVVLRYARQTPGIWQITSSGIKNEFPGSILRWLDRLNQMIYGPFSPLNWFTKRRDLIVYERVPENNQVRQLVDRVGIGRITLDEDGTPIEAAEVYSDGTRVRFVPK